MKFSIVTPVYNGQAHIRETIENVLSQEGNFEIEYFIMDGGSTDSTVKIAREYESRDKRVSVISEKDVGMYDAVNKGFLKATGDVYAYINSDDVYEPGAFATVTSIVSKYPDILWLKGISSVMDASSNISRILPCYVYKREWIEKGIYGRNAPFIGQESVFWKAELWKKAGPIDKNLRLAGDYYLWLQFARIASLWSVNIKFARFRILETQLTSRFMNEYRKEQLMLSKQRGPINAIVKLFFWLKSKTPGSWDNLFFHAYSFAFASNEQYIEFDNQDLPIKKKAHSFAV